MRDADRDLTSVLAGIHPGKALDLAAGSGRHSLWLAERGWDVTAIELDIEAIQVPAVQCPIHWIRADLEKHGYRVAPESWDLIVCWLYWQPDLLPDITRGVRKGGIVALAGKTSGRFATSLEHFREAFNGWIEVASGQNESRAFFIGAKELVD